MPYSDFSMTQSLIPRQQNYSERVILLVLEQSYLLLDNLLATTFYVISTVSFSLGLLSSETYKDCSYSILNKTDVKWHGVRDGR